MTVIDLFLIFLNKVSGHLTSWMTGQKIESYQNIQKVFQDTCDALSWTCKSLIALSKQLLTDSVFKHDYVKLGFFQQDDFEKHFVHI